LQDLKYDIVVFIKVKYLDANSILKYLIHLSN